MSRRNRIVCGAIIVVVSFIMAVPAPAFAVRQAQEKLPQTGAWELAWSWFTSVIVPGQHGARALASRWETEGGGMDPNGQKAPNVLPTLTPSVLRADGGGR